MRTFDDFVVGDIQAFGAYAVTRDEVLAFAHKYDPSPQHIDDAGAAANPLFGRICASGAHTIAMVTRMMVDHWSATGEQGMGSPGFSVRFVKPVFPGDTLYCRLEIIGLKASESRPRFGAVHFKITASNQRGAAVLELTGSSLHERRDYAAG